MGDGPIVKKVVTHVDTTFIEGGKAAPEPIKMVAVAAVIQNPWAGQDFVENLRPVIMEQTPPLGDLLVPLIFTSLDRSTISKPTARRPLWGTMAKWNMPLASSTRSGSVTSSGMQSKAHPICRSPTNAVGRVRPFRSR